MNVEPILTAPLAIQLHVATIVVALVATAIILPMKKGTRVHRAAGWIWAISMVATAIISFWIATFEMFLGFNPIHLLSVLVLYSVPSAIISIRRGDVAAHKKAMLSVTFGGLGLAGAFTFLPGRTMWEVFFG